MARARWKWVALAAAIAQIAGSWFPSGAGTGQSVGERSALVTTPATPAGYAFAIWGVIFALAIAFTVLELVKRERSRADSALPAFALACAANAAWEVWVQLRGIDGLSVVIIAVGLVAAITALVKVGGSTAPSTSSEGFVALAATGLLAGWLGVAAFANIAALLKGAANSANEPMLAGALITAAAMLVSAIAWRNRGRVWLALASAWGLAAVVVRNLDGGSALVAGVAVAGVVLLVAVCAVATLRSRTSAPTG